MAGLPSGTVSMLFSDMEGSTALMHRLGQRWPETLDLQRRICRAAWSRHDGEEMGTEGDSFFVVFATAADALSAAVEAQTALGAASWPEGEPVRVRMGIHTGSPLRHGDGYVGVDVHRAARVSAAAAGGQVLISEATLRLVDDALPAGVTVRDLGEHLLRDIPTRTRLFRVVVPGVPEVTIAPKTLGGAGNLPQPLTDIVGREGELAELRQLLEQGTRLVTLTGPGGCGKTRLGLALGADTAGRYADGVYFVDLSTLATADQMWPTMSLALDVPADSHLPPGFFDHVAPRTALVILDNLEQILGADAVVRELLSKAPHVRVVATSRRPLHIAGEYDHAVPPLLLPRTRDYADIEMSGAVQLFCQHARRARRTFVLNSTNATAVADVCAALDGLPLALELVAARTKLLSAPAILTRIDRALDIVTPEAAKGSRQRTLRETIAWSYELLSTSERHVLNHLSVFEGDADLAAIAAVVPSDRLDGADLIDVLFGLVDASLVKTAEDATGEPRFSMLGTISRFAAEMLDQGGQREMAIAAHAQYYYDLARTIVKAAETGHRAGAADRTKVELGNLFAAATREPTPIIHDADYPVGLVPPLHVTELVAECFVMAESYASAVAVARHKPANADEVQDPIGAAACLLFAGRALIAMNRWEAAMIDLTNAVDIIRTGVEADSPHITEGSRLAPLIVFARCSIRLARLRADTGDFAGARELLTEVQTRVAREPERLGQSLPSVRALILDGFSYLEAVAGNYARAAQWRTEARALDEAAGDLLALAHYEVDMALIDVKEGRNLAATQRLTGALDDILEQGSTWLTAIAAETFALAVGPADPVLCARACGATATLRDTESVHLPGPWASRLAADLIPIRGALGHDDWDAAFARGRSEDVVALLHEMSRRGSSAAAPSAAR